MILASEKNIGEALVAARLMTRDELDHAIDNVQKKQSPNLIIQLIEKDYLKFSVFQKFLMQNYKIRTAILKVDELPQTLITQVGLPTMEAKMVVPIMSKVINGGKKLALGMVNPLDEKTLLEISTATQHEVTPVLISLSDFKATLTALSLIKQRTESPTMVSFDDQLEFKANTEPPVASPEPYQMIDLTSQEQATQGKDYLGSSIKKYREEIALKLFFDEKDYALLKKENYSREDLMTALAGIKNSVLEKSFEILSAEAKFEALANSLIQKGLLTKHDILVSGAVSRAFGEESP